MLKILEVFTKKYKEETNYRIFMEQMIPCFKLNSDCKESVDDKVNRLIENKVVSNMRITIW